MKKETKNAIIKNGTVIALTISIIATMVGFAGGLSHYDTNLFKWITGCGLILTAILYAIKVTLEELGPTNKIVKITCVVAVIIAGILFICYTAAHISMLIIGIYPKTKPTYT